MTSLKYDIIIVGAGPAGIFAAIEAVRLHPGLHILMIDKGLDINERFCPAKENKSLCRHCSTCSMVSGWGGAGAYSDGKLTLSPEVGGLLDQLVGTRGLEELISYIDSTYLEFGAPEKVYGVDTEDEINEIQRRAVLADLKLIPAPIRHMGTGRTKEILKSMKDYLISKGVQVRTQTAARAIISKEGKARGIITDKGEELISKFVIVAPGREGSEWLVREAEKLGLKTAINPVDVGVRVELPAPVLQHLTDVIYESKFIFYSKTFDDKVRTFCMNPYGEVVQENVDGIITVNGHTHAEKKTSNTNFALLVSKTFTEPFKEPISYGRYVASLANLLGDGVLVQRLGDLTAGQRSTKERLQKGLVSPTLEEATPGDLSLVLPFRHLKAILEMLQALDKIAPGVYSRHTLLYGVEVKFYSSRLALKRNLETGIKGLYATGDGAGITRGLAQASAAGVIAARDIVKRVLKTNIDGGVS